MRRIALTSIDGEGGVGKTSACKLLCSDQDVQTYFKDGALVWIEVGKNTTVNSVKEKVAEAVDFCGGEKSAERIRSMEVIDFSAVVGIARKFFSNHAILVVIGNVWQPPPTSGLHCWAAALSKLASFPGSGVVVTARFESLAESPGFERVHLGRFDLTEEENSDWRLAENSYDAILAETPELRLSRAYKENQKKALQLSCGVPLGIGTLACLFRSRRKLGDDVASVLSAIETRSLGLVSKFVGEDMKSRVGHSGLFAAMADSLASLDERKGCRFPSKPKSIRKTDDGETLGVWNASYRAFPGKELSARYFALHMMQASSPRMSFPLLRHLWHIGSIEEATEVAILFVDIDIVDQPR